MPWLPLYASETDFKWLFSLLSADDEIAFIVSVGPKQWIAKAAIPFSGDARYCLWHVPSGPLPLLRDKGNDNGLILDPWKPWAEERTGADSSTPYFGAGHPGVIWLNARVKSKIKKDGIGMSSFEWIGNHYRLIGNPAHEATERYWKRLGRSIKKIATRIPREGMWDGGNAEIWALPDALLKIQNGAERNPNPS
jgi:hypothetical protein